MSALAPTHPLAPGWRRTAAKSLRRSASYLHLAATMREPERDQVLVVWLFVAGAVWLAASGTDHSAAALALSAPLLAMLVGLSAIDARYGIIPDSMTIVIACGGLLESALTLPAADCPARWGAALAVLACGAAFHALYRHVRGHDGFGLGDVKLLAAACLWVGATALPLLMMIAVLSACGSLAITRLKHRLSHDDAIPFGPHLAVAFWLVWATGFDGSDWIASLAA